jgi:DNA-binding GntR family transcriptional regulator
MVIERPKSLRELATELLRDRIIDGTLKMGQSLSERSISEELGVSKSPVREALAQLRDEGLVIIEPQKGARVFSLTENEVFQICDFRLAIETAGFKLALERSSEALALDMDKVVAEMTKAQDTRRYLQLDTRFHQLIFIHSRNDYLTACYDRYLGKIAALRTHLSSMPDHTRLSFEEHGMLAEAVRRRNLPKIEALLHEHIERTRTTYSQSVEMLGAGQDKPERHRRAT